MKKHSYLSIVLVWTFFCVTPHVFAQDKWQKMINKAEAAYTIGDYETAISSLEKFRKKSSKKFGQQNQYTPAYYMLLAKYNLASGMIIAFEGNVKAAIDNSILVNKVNTLKHGSILLDAAELNNQNGSYRISREYLNTAKENLEAGNLFSDPIKARWDMDMATALTGQGYFNEALEILQARERYFAGRALRQESYVDEKGSLKSRRLSEDEIDIRFNEYARLLTLLGNTYGQQGNLKSADSAFVFAATWIKKNLGNTSLAYIKNQYYNANVLTENGNETLPKELEYSGLLNDLKANHKASHYFAINLYEAYLRQLVLGENYRNYARFLNTKLEFEKMINSSYDKLSVYRVRLRAVDFDSKLGSDKTKGLENDANNLIANSKGLSRYNTTTIRVIRFVYDLDMQTKNFAGAEKQLSDIIEIKTELYGMDAPETHLARLQLANFYLDNTNKISEANKIYDESYTKIISKQIGAWHKDHLDILNHMAALYELTDKYKEASTTLDKASEVARSKYSDTDYQYGVELNNIARLEIKLGLYEKAEANINKSLKILEDLRKDEVKNIYLIKAIETQAILFGIKGMFDDAEEALSRTAKIIRKSDNLVVLDELSSQKELSTLQIQLGRYANVEDLLNILIPEYEKQYGNNSIRLIEPLVDRGLLTLAVGDYTEAEKIAQRANQIAVSVYGEKSTKTAPVQRLLSDIYYTIGDYDKAETNLEKALVSQESQFGKNHIEVAKSLSQLSLIRFYKGEKLADVEKVMLESLDIMGKRLGKDNPQYAEILKNIATLYIAQKKYSAAFTSLTQAETIWLAKAGRKNNINLASIYTLTGDVYYNQKNYAKAEEFYDKGKKLYLDKFSKTHPEYVKVLSKQAKVYYMQKNFKKAKNNIEESLTNYEAFIKQFFPALSEREKAKYWNTIKGDFEFYNTLAFGNLEDFRDLSGKVYNYQLLTKALLLSSSIKIRERILGSKDENLKESYNLWVLKKEALTNALSMSAQQLVDGGIDPVALTNEVEALEKSLSEKSEIFGQNFENKKITYSEVQKSLGKNDVAVEMVRFRHFDHVFTDSIIYVALYVKNDGARPKVIELPEGHRMETRFFKYYRNSITGKMEDAYSYKVFWEPINKQIGQAATIYLSPDGVYNQLNLEAIPTPDGKFVIDNANIVIVSNTKDLYLRKQKSKSASTSSNSATMFGNPTFYLTASAKDNIPALPGTEKEVKELEDLLKQRGWNTSEYMETSATEERVKELASPRIFHVATHGFYTPSSEVTEDEALTENEAMMTENPLLKTGLLLKGAGDVLGKTKYNYNMESGILTAYEAMSLNLDQTDLVVLSACETGLGDISNGEGVYGLQRAFLVAGAKVLVMSMFKVDDEATQKLILSFYRKWLTSGNMRQSFIDAKKELRVDYPEPIYWGAFMMIGLENSY